MNNGTILFISILAWLYILYRQNAFEVVSMDGQSVVVNFDDSEEDRQEWYDSVYNNISLLNQQEVYNKYCILICGNVLETYGGGSSKQSYDRM